MVLYLKVECKEGCIMAKYKNTILILLSIIFFAYAGFISIFPAFLTSSFNIDKFEQKVYDSTSLVTTVDTVEYKIKPNFDTIISLRNWSSKYIDDQDCFDASLIEITTTPAAIFGKTFKIKQLYLKNVRFSNQTLPSGENKLAFLPGAFNSKVFGADKIVIIPGPVKVKNFRIKDIAPGVYNERNQREALYSEQDVKSFLTDKNFSHIIVK